MNMLHLFKTYTVEQITGVETNISADMYNAIALWADMAAGTAPWNKKAPPCGVLKQITSRIAMLVSREIGIDVSNDAIREPLEHLNANIDALVGYMVLLGGCVCRPVFSSSKLQYELVPLGHYLPTRYDFDGTLTGALLLKHIVNGSKKWLLTEKHEYDGTEHHVVCELYRNDGGLKKTSLADCPQTAHITPEYTWQHVAQPMIIEFRNPAVNTIDGSNVPVSLIAGAENLIADADRQYERMNWEQQAGEMTVFADRDMFALRKTRTGDTVGTVLTPELKRLLVMIDGDGSTDGKKLTEHAPALRTTAQNEMFQQILRRIELSCGIGKGTISDMESVQQTATQYSGGRQELYAIVDKIEDEIEHKYHRAAAVFAHMAAAYKLGSADSKIVVTFNDDITRKDIQQAKQMELQEISVGVRNKWEYRRDFFGEDETQAKANTPDESIAPDPFGLA